jgi:hydrogenase nickel incorporation protein HypA/HybF
MHELSIAQEIVEIIKQSVPNDQWHLIISVKLELGIFSNILADSLLFCYEASVNNTEIEKAKLIIEEIPLTIHCQSCFSDTVSEDFLFYCPKCLNPNISFLTGQEMKLTEIELQ